MHEKRRKISNNVSYYAGEKSTEKCQIFKIYALKNLSIFEAEMLASRELECLIYLFVSTPIIKKSY